MLGLRPWPWGGERVRVQRQAQFETPCEGEPASLSTSLKLASALPGRPCQVEWDRVNHFSRFFRADLAAPLPFWPRPVFFSAVVRPRPILSDLHLRNLLHSPIDVAELSQPTHMKIHHDVVERIRNQRLNDDDAACSQEA
jgi:hypothetical protein